MDPDGEFVDELHVHRRAALIRWLMARVGADVDAVMFGLSTADSLDMGDDEISKRTDDLVAVGFAPANALALAMNVAVDVHAAVDLVGRGATLEQAASLAERELD